MAFVRLVALLRAINVGGHTVRMTELKDIFEGMGFRNVSTVIASGNVIFETTPKAASARPALEVKIERGLEKALGYEVGTFLRTPKELATIAASTPLDAAHASDSRNVLYVNFLRRPLAAGPTKQLLALANDVDDFAVDGSEFYWLQRRALGESRIKPAQFARVLSEPGTSRNITSVRRIALKCSG